MRASLLALTLVAPALVLPAFARAGKLPPPSKLTLVQAQCPGPPPGPCSQSFAFAKGVAVLTSQRQPKPTCPKTGMPDETSGGSITLKGVTASGTKFEGSLDAEVTLFTTFGTDPNGDCELDGTQITTPSLIATLSCRHGKCKGTLRPIACLPASCADTPITSEFRSLVVRDDAGQPMAAVGTTVAAASN